MLILLSTAVAIYAAITALAWVFQRQLIYDTSAAYEPPGAAGLPGLQEVTFPAADGLTVRGWFHPPADGQPTILYLQGNAGNLALRSEKFGQFRDRGFGLLAVNYRGYSGAAGTPTEDGLYADAEGALSYLDAQRGIPPGDIVVHGESLGTGPATEMAHRHPVGALVLESPFTSLPRVAQKVYWYLPARPLVADRYANIAKIAEIDAPVFIIHGLADPLIPPQHSRDLHAAARAPKRLDLVAGAHHSDLHQFGLVERMAAFLADHWQPDSAAAGAT